MTAVALVGGQWMIAGFAGGEIVVVAGRTLGRPDLPVVDAIVQRQPVLLIVTAVAQIGGRWVIAGFGGADTAAHVATHALIGGLTVIKRRRYRQPARYSDTHRSCCWLTDG